MGLVREKMVKPRVAYMIRPNDRQLLARIGSSQPDVPSYVWNPDGLALSTPCDDSPQASSQMSSPSTMVSGADSFEHSPMVPYDDFEVRNGFDAYTQ